MVKLFLKRPQAAQGLVQKVLQAATADNDNPDIRDRAYVYWRLLSNTSDSNAPKNIILSEKPPITTTIPSLPQPLLEQLLTELSTLASVYHMPPEQFVGQGRFGADAVQRAAIEYVLQSLRSYCNANKSHREQIQNAKENPLAAAAAAAAVAGKAPLSQTNAENLLDIDFDGAAPASAQEKPRNGLTGLEGLSGTPQRVASPVTAGPSAPNNNMDDLMGVFGNGGSTNNASAMQSSSGFDGMTNEDIMNGFASMNVSENSQPPPPQQQMSNAAGKKNEDLLSLF